jgi:hypothetical protein
VLQSIKIRYFYKGGAVKTTNTMYEMSEMNFWDFFYSHTRGKYLYISNKE